jgi:hypothetical protein
VVIATICLEVLRKPQDNLSQEPPEDETEVKRHACPSTNIMEIQVKNLDIALSSTSLVLDES